MNDNNRISSVWVAILGMLVGALLVMTLNKYQESKHLQAVQYRDWRKLNLILDKVEHNYVDTIDKKGMTDAAITAALAKLDPHSIYMPPVELEETDAELAGNFDGIGIQFNVPNDTAIVMEVIPGGPSEKIGLQQGDRLLRVNQKDIAGVQFPQDSMVKRMKGPSGSKVTITVLRNGQEIPFEITRGKIPTKSVDAHFMIDDHTGYIKLSKFSRTTFIEFAEAAVDLLSHGMTRLMFDLRDNTGGYMDEAINICNQFLSKGDKIVYMEGLHRKREESKADGKGLLQDIDLTILINESSASSSEIVAGAIQDNDRGVIVGRRSFGKGLVQEPIYFTDGSGVRITVARYYTPSGRCIQKPYGEDEDYRYDLLKRYADGEMLSADSIKIDKSIIYKTTGGREVYGGGGIVPDVFVPMDTTRATRYYSECSRKATPMRFASAMFDTYRDKLASIDDYDTLNKFLDDMDIPTKFKSYAARVDRLVPSKGEWEETEEYLVPQLRALVGRYSRLGDNAFYKLYIDIDKTIEEALKAESVIPKKGPLLPMGRN